ncbi:hypothetical protein ABZV61_38800 [Streptomyces sp900116325]|uniref:Amidohydrolase n=1 Tax=Streptomyces sp. 900116325 TaxID=3154295 RepID=A0ABV2UL41_9ACTN
MTHLRIDVHAHLWTPAYLDRLERLGKTDTDTQRGIGADATEADLDRRFEASTFRCSPWHRSPHT